MKKNILMASLGIANYYKSVYTWDSEKHFTPYACLAMLSLLKQKGTPIDEMHLFLTENAYKKYGELVEQEAKELGVKTEFIEVSEGKTLEEVWGIFDGIVDFYSESENINLYLDITYGFRHLSMIFLASTMYLESLNAVKLSGVFYGAFEARTAIDIEKMDIEAVKIEFTRLKNSNAPTREYPTLVPIFDLTALAKIIMGSFAVRQFEKSGDLLSVQKFLTDVFEVTEEEEQFREYRLAIRRLELLHYSAISGLPMEAGYNAKGSLERIDKLPKRFEVKALKDLLIIVRNRLAKISIKSSSRRKEDRFALDMPELERQLEFINWHLETSNIATTLLLLREWIVTRMYMEEVRDENWLNSKKREGIEKKLGFWKDRMVKERSLFEDEPAQKELVKVWNELYSERNKFAHAGMQINRVNPETTGLEKARKTYEFCLKNLEDSNYWRLPEVEKPEVLEEADACCEQGEERALVTPLGSSRGLLYTAIKLVKPDRIVVLTSEMFKGTVEEVCQKAGFTDNNKIHIKVISDPFSGFEEGAQLAAKVVSSLKNIKDLYVSFTGGTTAMQFAMQELWDLAKTKFPSKRVAFVDKRAVTEQQSNPYVVGEILHIDELLNRKGD